MYFIFYFVAFYLYFISFSTVPYFILPFNLLYLNFYFFLLFYFTFHFILIFHFILPLFSFI